MSASYCAAKRSRTIAEDAGVATAWSAIISAMLLMGVVVLSTAPAAAQSDVFTVSSVSVDATGRSTTEARTKGLQSGRLDALDHLFKRLVPRAFHGELPDLSTRDAIDLVQDFSVANERSSSTRYLADLTVRFRPDAVRSTLRFANVPFSETVSKPIVIVPLYQESIVSEPILWQDPNPWRDAWYGVAEPDGLVPRQLPYGDLEDLTQLRVGDAIARDSTLIRQWASRYGADDAVVASASLMGGVGSESVRVNLYFIRSGRERQTVVPATGGQTWADLFKAAATEAWLEIEDEWKQENMLQFDMSGQITALVPLNTLEDWLTVKQRLQQVPLIDRFELQAMTRDRAQVTVYYLGSESQLELNMAQLDLGLVSQDDAWIIEDRQQDAASVPELRGGTSPASPVPNGIAGNRQSNATRQMPPPAYPPELFQSGQSGNQLNP